MSTSRLDSTFNPFAVHPFTNMGSSPSGNTAPYATGIPSRSYPGHVVAASTSPEHKPPGQAQPSTATSQSPTASTYSHSSSSSVPIQMPRPRQSTRGFGNGTGTTSSQTHAIFDPFEKQRLTPDLDDLPLIKRRANAWGTKELEESIVQK